VAGGLFAANACRVAAAHDAKCIDTLRAFNGPQGDEPAGELLASDYTHPSAKGMALIARLLSETSSR
jgi:lysophospholipase L1-like esterase